MKLKPGKNKDISNEDYHGDREYISSSGLKLLLKDEREFHRKYVQNIRERNKAQAVFDFGTYIHALILEPWTVKKDFEFYDGIRRYGRKYDEFCENSDKIVITRGERSTGEKIIKRYNEEPVINSFVSGGEPEATYCGDLDGLNIKVRADYITKDYILDVKTTSAAVDKLSIQDTILKYDYDLSAALYLDVAKACGEGCEDFYFLFINKSSCDMVLARADERILENGRKKYKKAIKRHHRLKKEGFFDKMELDVVMDVSLPWEDLS